MPHHYVQAVGSGTGGIAAYEAAGRLAADGRFGTELPRLHLAQNLPFTPMYDAWSRDEALDPEREPNELQVERIGRMYASVLANTHPPYNSSGGVREALQATRGQMYAVTNEEARAAGARFAELEGIDISPPAACACAALEQALARGPLEVLGLHLGGGVGADRRIRRPRVGGAPHRKRCGGADGRG